MYVKLLSLSLYCFRSWSNPIILFLVACWVVCLCFHIVRRLM